MMRAFAATNLVALTSGILFAQSIETTPRFEVADIHRSGRANNPYAWVSGGVLRGARYDLRKATMLDLIQTAWGVEPDTVLGGPSWLELDRSDIAAKAPPSTSPENIKLMLRALLADRFKLILHKDTRPMPAFVLTIGNAKSKLRASNGAYSPACQSQPQSGPSIYAIYSCRNMTMEAFAKRLRQMAGDYLIEPVVNLTAIEGAWDFDLKWNPRSQVLPGGIERTTIFDAIERQLGLALELRKAPAPVLIVDRVNEKPTENPPEVARMLPPRELEFEVADVKPSRPDEKGCCFEVTPGGGLTARAMPMVILLCAAWDIDWNHADQIVGAPKWIYSERFDINAKASTTTNGPPLRGSGYIDDDVRLMLRALLTDRFQMKTHYEDRLIDAYTLTAVRPKLKKADPTNRANCKEARTLGNNDPRDLNPKLSRLIACRNVTMAQFAAQLQGLVPDQFTDDVADATGINGAWDFTLSFSEAWQLQNSGGNSGQPASDAAAASDPNGGVSLADAIGRQLGLKLEKRKRLLPVLVIDHMEEKPTEN